MKAQLIRWLSGAFMAGRRRGAELLQKVIVASEREAWVVRVASGALGHHYHGHLKSHSPLGVWPTAGKAWDGGIGATRA